MEINKKLHSVALASTALVLLLILFSSTVYAAPEQSASSVKTYAYITNAGSKTMSVIDADTDIITATVKIGISPTRIAASSDGKKVYLVADRRNISVIDTATDTVTANITVELGTYSIAVSPDGKKVYVTDGDHNVSVIDTATNKVTATVSVGWLPNGVAVSPDGKKVYVANEGSDDVSVIDASINKVTAGFGTGYKLEKVAVSPDGRKLYVTNHKDHSSYGIIFVFDTVTGNNTAMVNLKSIPSGIVVSPDGKKLYVTDSDGLNVIDTETNTIVATVQEVQGGGVAVTPDGKKVYVTGGLVYVIDTATNAVTATVDVGGGPSLIGISSILIPKQLFPIAYFSAPLTTGKAPLTVTFYDKSTGSPTLWTWDFGDGGTLNSKIPVNPVHKYDKAGKYTVSLTATNEKGRDTKKIFNYITVN